MELQVTDPAHHPLGASSSDRWLHCPGSVIATQGLPDTDSAYSIEGTAAHSLAEMARQGTKPVKDYVGVQIPVELVDGSFQYIIVSPEMAEHVQGFVDYLSALPGDDYNESRIYVDPYIPGAFGTLDAAKVTAQECHIVDLKFGQGIQVDAKANPQLMFYALGFFLTYGWMYDIRKFHLHVYQPRRDHEDRWEIALEHLMSWAANVLRPGAELTSRPDAPFKAGEWCKFCKLKASCVTRAKAVFEMNLDEMDDLDSAIDKDAPALTLLTPDQKARILRRKPLVTAFYAALEAEAFNEVKHGRQIGDFKIVRGKTSRSWAVTPIEVTAALEVEELDPTQLFSPPEIISPAQAEKKYGKKVFAEVLASLVSKSEGKPTLVPGSDNRPALDLSMMDELEDLDGTD